MQPRVMDDGSRRERDREKVECVRHATACENHRLIRLRACIYMVCSEVVWSMFRTDIFVSNSYMSIYKGFFCELFMNMESVLNIYTLSTTNRRLNFKPNSLPELHI